MRLNRSAIPARAYLLASSPSMSRLNPKLAATLKTVSIRGDVDQMLHFVVRVPRPTGRSPFSTSVEVAALAHMHSCARLIACP